MNINNFFGKKLKEIYKMPGEVLLKWKIFDEIIQPKNKNKRYIEDKISLFLNLKKIYETIEYTPKNKKLNAKNTILENYFKISRNKVNKILSSLKEEYTINIDTIKEIENKINEIAIDYMLIEEPIIESKQPKKIKEVEKYVESYNTLKKRLMGLL